jgi:hypothetical protein
MILDSGVTVYLQRVTMFLIIHDHADIALTTGILAAKQMILIPMTKLSYFGRMQYDYKGKFAICHVKTRFINKIWTRK